MLAEVTVERPKVMKKTSQSACSPRIIAGFQRDSKPVSIFAGGVMSVCRKYEMNNI